MFDITALGELLIDFTPSGTSEQGNDLLEVNPGGAPCNMLAMAAKLGSSTAFIGKVGADHFGALLKNTIRELGIDISGLCEDSNATTTLAFVHLDEQGDRSFTFCRKPGADTLLTPQEIPRGLIENTKILHFGTLSLTDEPARSATRYAIELARKSGCLLSFDPNIRPALWDSLQSAKEQMAYGLGACDILKISEEELFLVTEQKDIEHASETLLRRHPNIRLLLLTLGIRGCYYRFGRTAAYSPAFTNVATIDTTGAGDTFMGCCLHAVAQKGLEALTEPYLKESVRFANAAAALITTRKGALRVMPEQPEVQRLLKGEK